MHDLAVLNNLYEHALALHKIGNLSEAKSIYETIIAKRPEYDAAILHLGIIEHQSGRNENAIELIRQALAINSERDESYYNLGVILFFERRLSEAKSAFDAALMRRPYSHKAYAIRANLHKMLGDHHRAIADYECALAINPHSAEVRRDLAVSLLTIGNYERGGLNMSGVGSAKIMPPRRSRPSVGLVRNYMTAPCSCSMNRASAIRYNSPDISHCSTTKR